QAEDGIRDFHVTGVQTCALPISIVGGRVLPMFSANGTQTKKVEAIVWLDRAALASLWLIFVLHFFALKHYLPPLAISGLFALSRSEERRVGKESRSRMAPCRYEE